MFFNAARNPNPPARCVPSSMEEPAAHKLWPWSCTWQPLQELRTLGVRDLRDLLRSEGAFRSSAERRWFVPCRLATGRCSFVQFRAVSLQASYLSPFDCRYGLARSWSRALALVEMTPALSTFPGPAQPFRPSPPDSTSPECRRACSWTGAG